MAQAASNAFKVPENAVWHDLAVEQSRGFIILPRNAKSGAGKPWVWYAPTFIGWHPGAEQAWLFPYLLEAGLPIAGVEVGESYGNPAGRAIFTAFHRQVTTAFGLAAKACLLPQSRGGLMLYNWAVEHPELVQCVAGIFPVCNLESYPGLAKAAPAYGLSEEGLRAALKAHNPFERLAPLAARRVPLFHIHGDRDTLVPLDANSAELARRYRELGGEIELVIVAGKGHEVCPEFFRAQRLADFLIAQARRQHGA